MMTDHTLHTERPPHTTKRRRLRASMAAGLPLALLAVVVLALTFMGGDSGYATSFNPTADVSLTDPTADASSNIVSTFGIEAPDSNFGMVINFTPPEFFVAADVDIPNGSLGAHLSSFATLGLINGACTPTGLNPQFDMKESTTDINGPRVGFNDDDDPGTVGEIFEALDSDNKAAADALAKGVEMYPEFLYNTFYDEQGNRIKPRSRLFGMTLVVGVDVALNFVIFEPGTTFKSPTTGNVFRPDPALGYPSVTILQNAGDPTAEPEPGAITDFCTPLTSTTETFGLAGGTKFRGNPGDGVYNFLLFSASLRDADDDGYENNFDTCPYDVNLDGDPRGEADPEGGGEGIDSACDPDPAEPCDGAPGAVNFTADCDADGFSNRGDNCPWIQNGEQQADVPDVGNQRDRDGDGIGDACDQNPDVPDGHFHIKLLVSPVTVGAGGGSAPAAEDYLATAEYQDDPLMTVVCLDLDHNAVCDMDEGGGGMTGTTPTPTATATTDTGTDTDTGTGTGTDTSTGTGTGGNGAAGGVESGVGSLAPVASSISAWAAIASALGGAGLLGSLGAIASRIWRRRRQ